MRNTRSTTSGQPGFRDTLTTRDAGATGMAWSTRVLAFVVGLLVVAAMSTATAVAGPAPSGDALTPVTLAGERGHAPHATKACAAQRTKLTRFDRQRAKKLRDFRKRVASPVKRRAFVKRQAAERLKLKRALDRCRKAAAKKGTPPSATPTPAPATPAPTPVTPAPSAPGPATSFRVNVQAIEGRGRIQASVGGIPRDIKDASEPGATAATPRARLSASGGSGPSAVTVDSSAGADYTLRRAPGAAGQESIEFACTASSEAHYTGHRGGISLFAEGECAVSLRILVAAPTNYRLERSATSAPDAPKVAGTPQAHVTSSWGDAPTGTLAPGEYQVGGRVMTSVRDTELGATTFDQMETGTISFQLDLSPAS